MGMPVTSNSFPSQLLELVGAQSVSITATASSANAVGSETIGVLLYATVDCHITVDGSTPTTSSAFLRAGFYVPIAVRKGTTVVKVIRAVSDGTLYIWELA